MTMGEQKARGFTLLELVIVMIVIGVMAAVLAPVMLSSLQAYDATLGNVVVLDKLRYATERLAREIRAVQYASSATTPTTNCGETTPTTDRYCINTMAANSLVFRMCRTYDFTAVPTTCNAFRTVTIGTASTASAACVTPPCVTIAYSDMVSTGPQVLTDELGVVGNLNFAYFNSAGNNASTTPAVTVTTANVGFVEISLTLSHNGNPYTQRTRVSLRNIPIT